MYLGIEIGGTKLQFGVGPADGHTFIDFVRRDIDRSAGATGILQQILTGGRDLVSRHGIQKIGYGFGGPVFGAQGIIQTSHQVTGWDRFPLGDWTQRELGIPARLGNDCDVAALAEATYGAAREARTVFYVTVGTGIGGGWVQDRQIYGTERPAAAEIGHLRPGLDATDRHQTLESLAAGPAIPHQLQRLMQSRRSDDPEVLRWLAVAGGDVQAWNSRQIGRAAVEGLELPRLAYQQATTALGWGLASMITLLAPQKVVVGGGVSLVSEDVFWEPLRAAVTTYVFPPLIGTYDLVPAALGERVVVHGALALAASPVS